MQTKIIIRTEHCALNRELTTLIKSIYSKNNNYLSMDRHYEDDKTLAKNNWFETVVLPKKTIGYMIDIFINNAIISSDIF